MKEEKHSEVSEKIYCSENGDSTYLNIVKDKEPEVKKKIMGILILLSDIIPEDSKSMK